ncbi:MAG: glycerophosphodiester phosphodiesterase family protein [Desulfobulbaceae bacterium]|nr:glycerophosphodiester phosphodiesterase family protein [Desulfobulbaceae bacterium]
MRYSRLSPLCIFISSLICAFTACSLLSCGAGERIGSYIDYRQMTPPVAEPLSFEIVGHRGYGSATPENTLAALRRSISEAVKVAEVDIRLTSDGVPVLLHDSSLSRTTGDHHLVSELTLAEIKKLDAGSYKSIEFLGEKIPTFEEALLLADSKLKLLLHVKITGAIPAIAAVLRKTAFPVADIWIMSDQLNVLPVIGRLMPGVRLVHLAYSLPTGVVAQREFVQKQLRAKVPCVALALDAPDEEYMALAHSAGLRVIFWTADHPYDSVVVDRFTADGVVTDKPIMWEDWAALIKSGG